MAKQASNLVALDGMRRIFSAEQHFSDPWVGSSALNRAGLHLGRVLASAAIDRVRTALALHKWPSPSSAREARDLLARDGIVVLERFLDPARAEALRAELGARFAEADASFPPSACDEHGYGARRPFEAGFDRCDGSTANRFLRIDATRMPESTAFVRDASLLGLLGATVGIRPDPARFFGYRNRLGYDATNHDIQLDLHRDTFQPAFKLWYFVDDVGEDEGPFEYVVGSPPFPDARAPVDGSPGPR